MVQFSSCRVARRCPPGATGALVGLLSMHLLASEAGGQTAPASVPGACATTDLYQAPIVPVPGGETRLRIFLNPHRATLEVPFRLADFCMHAMPVTRESWYATAGSLPGSSGSPNSVDDPTGEPSPAEQQLPITGITQQEAAAYCASVGGRLPTESEWEFAAVARVDNLPPPQTQPVDTDGQPLANLGWDLDEYDRLSPVMAFRAGPFGIYDMIGNAAEWTASAEVFVVEPWRQLTSQQPEEDTAVVYKGGSFADHPDVSRRWEPRARSAARSGERLDDVGFRCAFDAATPQD